MTRKGNMPKHAEVIYEDGSHSIVAYDDPAELQSMATENHRRAINGEPSAAQDMTPRMDLNDDDNVFGGMGAEGMTARIKVRPAFRIKKVLLYDQHPADLVPVGNDGTMPISVDAVKQLVDGMADGGTEVNMHQLIQALRDEASPVLVQDAGKFESHYKMPESSVMDLGFLNDGPVGNNGVTE